MGEIEDAAAALMKGWKFEKGKVPPGGDTEVKMSDAALKAMADLLKEADFFPPFKPNEEDIKFEGDYSKPWPLEETESGTKAPGESGEKKEGTGEMKQEKKSTKEDPCAARLADKDRLIDALHTQISDLIAELDRHRAKALAKSKEIATLKKEVDRLVNDNYEAATKAHRAEQGELETKRELEELKDETYTSVPPGMTVTQYVEHLEGRLRAYDEFTDKHKHSTHWSSARCRECEGLAPTKDKEDRFDPLNHGPLCPVAKARASY